MARNARRNYVRDGRGRFSSTPGGGPAKKAKPARTSFRQRQAVSLARQRGQTGRMGSATKAMKAKLAASRKKLATNASPQQKAAVTRAARMAAMLAGQRRIKAGPQAGVLRGAAVRGVKKAAGVRVRPGAPKALPAAKAFNKVSFGQDAQKTRFIRALTAPGIRAAYATQRGKQPTALESKKIARAKQTAERARNWYGTPNGNMAATAKPKPTRPTSKVAAPGSRRKVRGPKMAGTIAKPKGVGSQGTYEVKINSRRGGGVLRIIEAQSKGGARVEALRRQYRAEMTRFIGKGKIKVKRLNKKQAEGIRRSDAAFRKMKG